jgi:adenylyl-sulfate kinase
MRDLHPFAYRIGRPQREQVLQQRAHVFWLTGLSGSGKSTLADLSEVALHEQGYKTFVLDGDHLRGGLCSDLGFSDADRSENIRRAGETCRLLWEAGLVVITTFVSPFATDRDRVRRLFPTGAFSEVFLDASLEDCEARDPKGLYRKARAGQLKQMTGIDSPYEVPEHPELVLPTGIQPVRQSVEALTSYMISMIRYGNPVGR